MGEKLNRRQALVAAGGAALAVEAALLAGTVTADAAAPTVRGAWLFTPEQGGHAAAFQAISCFAAGGVFVTTGADEVGTGLGEWITVGSTGFAFTYLNFHFGANGKLKNTVKVRAKGTFHGTSLSGQATLTTEDPYGTVSSPSSFTFSGKRIAVEAP